MSDLTNENTSNPVIPTLTLDPVLETNTAENEVIQNPVPAAEENPAEALTAEELAAVDSFKNQIDIKNSAQVMSYGAGTQQKLAGFAEKALENVKAKDVDEVGIMLTDLVNEIQSFDADENDGGFLSRLFKNTQKKVESLKTKYEKTEISVNKIVTALESHQIQLLKDISVLDQMYDMNKNYYKELTMYILAGKKKLEEIEKGELSALRQKAAETGKAEDAQAANDLQAQCDRFDKKLNDLELTRMVAIQTAPQIRLIQNNDTMMAEKIQSTIVNTIPLWKSQMVLALGISHSQQAIKAQQKVSDMTNELLKKNAEKLKMATTETAKESQRGIIDIETLKETNAKLLETLDEVKNIQEQGRQKRREAEAELIKMENDVKNKLLEMR